MSSRRVQIYSVVLSNVFLLCRTVSVCVDVYVKVCAIKFLLPEKFSTVKQERWLLKPNINPSPNTAIQPTCRKKICRQNVNSRVPQGLAEMCKRDAVRSEWVSEWRNMQSLLKVNLVVNHSHWFSLTNSLEMINQAAYWHSWPQHIPSNVSQHTALKTIRVIHLSVIIESYSRSFSFQGQCLPVKSLFRSCL